MLPISYYKQGLDEQICKHFTNITIIRSVVVAVIERNENEGVGEFKCQRSCATLINSSDKIKRNSYKSYIYNQKLPLKYEI